MKKCILKSKWFESILQTNLFEYKSVESVRPDTQADSPKIEKHFTLVRHYKIFFQD